MYFIQRINSFHIFYTIILILLANDDFSISVSFSTFFLRRNILFIGYFGFFQGFIENLTIQNLISGIRSTIFAQQQGFSLQRGLCVFQFFQFYSDFLCYGAFYKSNLLGVRRVVLYLVHTIDKNLKTSPLKQKRIETKFISILNLITVNSVLVWRISL